MTLSSAIALGLVIFHLAVIPGPGVMAVVARALSGGIGPAALSVGGIVLGDLLFLLSAIYGLSFVGEILGGLIFTGNTVDGGHLIWLRSRLLLKNKENINPSSMAQEKKTQLTAP